MNHFLRTYAPHIRVTIRDLATGKAKPIGPRLDGDLSDDIISLSTNKAYGRASGTWALTLPYRYIPGAGTYADAIFPDDLLLIEVDAGAGAGYEVVMLGLVDRASRVFVGSEILPRRQVRVSGQDLGKLLHREISWDISGAQAQTTASSDTAEADRSLPKPSPDAPGIRVEIPKQGTDAKHIVQSYMRRQALVASTAPGMCDELLKIFLGDLSGISPKITFTSTTDDSWKVWVPNAQYLSDSTAWEAMARYAHRPYNTLTTETIDKDAFEIRLERTPHDDKGKLTGVTFHEIEEAEIVDCDLGCSDSERVNLLCYWPEIYRSTVSELVEIAMADPSLTKFNRASIETHGYCPDIVRDIFVPQQVRDNDQTSLAQEGTDHFTGEAAKRARLFWNWYANNHNLESGTVVVHLSPHIKAGHGLLVNLPGSDQKMEYLIEQVGHNYSVQPATALTTLQVTRGQLH